MRWLLFAIAACSAPPAPSTPAVAPTKWPPVIDSHVHLTLWPVADRLAASGVLGVVDLAAPERVLGSKSPIQIMMAGPMLTHPDGYPLDAWGADGYGVGCGDAASVRTTIDRLAREGARVIKLALDDDGLDPALVPVAVEAAHAHHLKVAAHALSAASAARAASAGVDVLAHTPAEPLPDDVIAAWKGRAVISTLAAFGSDAAVDNLRKLRAAGATILYGTDLGNLRDAGPSADEMAKLRDAGLDDAAITAAMTTVPAAYWGFDFGGAYLELDRDPRVDARALLTPRGVHR
ncbi:MAG TPA: hypothetical protein VGO00_22020 [Kofleriaceae bacterium]|nr:hypothetical protein [Kofleriaceae bacterium]